MGEAANCDYFRELASHMCLQCGSGANSSPLPPTLRPFYSNLKRSRDASHVNAVASPGTLLKSAFTYVPAMGMRLNGNPKPLPKLEILSTSEPENELGAQLWPYLVRLRG